MSANTFEGVYDRANRLSTKPDLDADVRAEINHIWTQIHGGYDYSNPEDFGRFLAAFLRRRYQRIDADQRAQQLCGCGNPSCNVLSGTIPTALKPSWRWHDGGDSGAITPADARRFVNQHPGCVGVEDALSAWSRGRQQTEAALRRIITLASSGRPSSASEIDFADGQIPGGGSA